MRMPGGIGGGLTVSHVIAVAVDRVKGVTTTNNNYYYYYYYCYCSTNNSFPFMIMCLFVSPERTQAYQNRGNEPTSKSEAGYRLSAMPPKSRHLQR